MPPLVWHLLHMPHTATYAPRHKVGKAPVVFLVKEQVADPATERFLVVLEIYNLEHCLCVTGPRPETIKEITSDRLSCGETCL